LHCLEPTHINFTYQRMKGLSGRAVTCTNVSHFSYRRLGRTPIKCCLVAQLDTFNIDPYTWWLFGCSRGSNKHHVLCIQRYDVTFFLSFFLPFFLSSFLPFFLSSFLPFFLSSFLPFFLSLELISYSSICITLHTFFYIDGYPIPNFKLFYQNMCLSPISNTPYSTTR
jgi:hypothetical protein